MQFFASIVKAMLPGSVPFLLAGLAVGAILLYGGESARRWGRRMLTALAATYWFMSVPFGADLLTSAIPGSYRPLMSAADARGASTVVVLDGGTVRFRARGLALDAPTTPAALRALEALRVYRLLGDPLVVVTGGGDHHDDQTSPEGGTLRDAIVAGGVPAGRVVLDTESPSTRAHATTLARMLHDRGVSKIVLVTSPTHIRRAVWAFRAVGFDVIASPGVAYSEDLAPVWHWTNWRPSSSALLVSEESLRDALAIVYYQLQGWFSPASSVGIAGGRIR